MLKILKNNSDAKRLIFRSLRTQHDWRVLVLRSQDENMPNCEEAKCKSVATRRQVCCHLIMSIVWLNTVIALRVGQLKSAITVLEAMFQIQKILAFAVSRFTHFVLIYFIRLRVYSPPITAVSKMLPIHHGEPLSCVELPVMSYILVPRYWHTTELHLSELWLNLSPIIRIGLALWVNL